MSQDRLDHALVGNGLALALVAPDAHVDWLCLPRFDSPPVFGGLLDRERAGTFSVILEAGAVSEQRLHSDSNVLRTTLASGAAQVHVDDFCPPGEAALTRLLAPAGGEPMVQVHLRPRLDFGRSTATLEILGDHVARVGDVWITTDGPMGPIVRGAPFALERPMAITISHGSPLHLEAPGSTRDAALEADRAFAEGIQRAIRRSALCLNAHTYAPTGAIIAAATTSIPEAIGTPRTWDYRYAWVRDGCFAAEAFLRLGRPRFAVAFLDFLQDAIGDRTPQPLYGIGGETDLPESTVPGLRGFGDTGPVRVGNLAASQVQHDTWGQVIWLAERLAAVTGDVPTGARFPWIARLVEGALRVWDVPDAGIWEFRDRPGRYTFSRAWCWVALDRGASLARLCGLPDLVERWTREAAVVRSAILESADRAGFFAQTADCEEVDASSLLLPALGLVPATDPRFLATVARCEETLMVDGLMRRYVAEDDFGKTSSTFSLCTLWWIEALARLGRRTRARTLLQRFLARGNPHGLFSEDIEPGTGRLLGNFPQVYTHVGLISAWLAVEDGGATSADGSPARAP